MTISINSKPSQVRQMKSKSLNKKDDLTNDKRKVCPKGLNCPYQMEYQHQLEFKHLNTTSSNESKQQASSFSGSGNKLGGNSKFEPLSSHPLLDNLQSKINIKPSSDDDKLHCELCQKSYFPCDIDFHFSGSCLENHFSRDNDYQLKEAMAASLKQQERNEKNEANQLITREQDNSYAESLLEDTIKQTVIEDQRKLEERKKLEDLEDEQMKQAQEESRKLLLQNRQDEAKLYLQSEPFDKDNTEKTVTIKFIFPSGFKATRKFLLSRPFQDVFTFLDSLNETLLINSYSVKPTIGNLKYQRSNEKSFQELDITSNCILIIVEEDSTTIDTSTYQYNDFEYSNIDESPEERKRPLEAESLIVNENIKRKCISSNDSKQNHSILIDLT